jgi:predicted dehydrogenase
MKILVVGCGSIGKRHIRNLISINAGEIIACDTSKGKLDDVRTEFSIKTFSNIEEALNVDEYTAAFICSPPSFHVTQALQLVNMGVHCFIEKPLSRDLTGVDELIELSSKKKKVVLIGYTIRFSFLLNKMKEMIDNQVIGNILFLKASVGYYLPYWRPSEDYRKGYGAKAELGGGILLDASHEIDYIRYLAGEVTNVSSICKKLSNLEINTEDFAEITMHHENGIYSQIHLDYLQSNYRRSCEVVGDNGMLIWDINERVLKQYSLKDKEYHVYYEGLNADSNAPFIEETKHFFRCIRGLEKPLICLKEGKRVQEILLKIKESSAAGRTLTV